METIGYIDFYTYQEVLEARETLERGIFTHI